MKNIYWVIWQTKELTEVEIATIDIINRLSKYRKISLVIVGKENNNELNISSKVEIIYLNVEDKYIYSNSFMRFYYFLFNRNKIKKKLNDITKDDNIIIYSDPNTYILALKKRRTLFHFHYNYKTFFSLKIKLYKLFYRNPDKFIFINESTKKKIEKKKVYKGSYHIYNPSIVNKFYNINYYNNELIYIAPFEKINNPMLAIKIAEELKNMNLKFHLTMYGSGSLLNDMKSYISNNNLEKYMDINSDNIDLNQIYKDKDLLIYLSNNYYYPHTIIDASNSSIPTLTYKFNEMINEVVIDNENGYLLDDLKPITFANKIKELCFNKKKLLGLKERSFNFSNRFSNDVIISKWLDILNIEDEIIPKLTK